MKAFGKVSSIKQQRKCPLMSRFSVCPSCIFLSLILQSSLFDLSNICLFSAVHIFDLNLYMKYVCIVAVYVA